MNEYVTGAIIKELREKHHLTQAELAEKINVSDKTVSKLSSYKDKHKKMLKTVDFIKIKDYAVINLNNMILVSSDQIIELDINKEKDLSYRYLLQAESREVNRQKNRIRKNAEIVYSHKIHNGNTTALAKRTNDFGMLEKLCGKY